MTVPPFSELNSVKERILENIVTTLQAITIANGYSYDVGSVLRYRIAGFETVDYPTILVVGSREAKVRRTASPDKTDVQLFITCEIIATNDNLQDSETYHNLLMRDVEAALVKDVTRGGIARYTDITGTAFTVVAQQDPFALSVLNVTVAFQHSTEDPTKAR